MEIEETKLDEDRRRNQAIFSKNVWNDLHAINWRPKAQEYDGAMSFLAQTTWLEGDQTLRGNKAPGCKW